MTLPISAAEMNRVMQVWRPTTTDDQYAGKTLAYVKQPRTVRAMVSEPTAAERVAAMQAEAQLTIAVHLAPDADVRRGDELRDDLARLRVKSTIAPSTRVYLRADCEQLQYEGIS